MPVQIAVWDPLLIYRRGMMTALASVDLYPEEPENLLQWAAEQQQTAILITLQSPQDWVLLRQLRSARPELILVALLPEGSVEMYVRAVEGEAAAAVARDALPETVAQVFHAAVKGMSILPVEVVRALTKSPAADKEPSSLESRQVEWLRALSNGITITQLAESAGYSERAMYRLLRDLYQRMRVANRTEAVLKASRAGWL